VIVIIIVVIIVIVVATAHALLTVSHVVPVRRPFASLTWRFPPFVHLTVK
jgi:hypothetical protein